MSIHTGSHFGKYDDANLLRSLKLRYPQALLDSQTSCYLCLNDCVENATSIYEKFTCQGVACLSAGTGSGEGAVTVVCEQCALLLDLRERVATKRLLIVNQNATGSGKVQKNMTCQCPFGTDALVKTYGVKSMPQGDTLFALDRAVQYGAVMNSSMLFKQMPSRQAMAQDPDALTRHYAACYMTNDDNTPVTGLSFNAKIASLYNNMQSERVSLQILPGATLPGPEAKIDYIEIICSAPVTTTCVTPVEVQRPEVTRGDGTRSVRSKGVTRGGAGTSSNLAGAYQTAQPTGNVICMKVAFPDTEGTGLPIELVCDGILPPGSSNDLMLRLQDMELQSTKPSFCPISKIGKICTNVSATSAEDATKRELLMGIVLRHEVAYEVVDDVFVLLDVDTGKNTIFTNIQTALLVCGFGDRAEKWDWHIVVLRRGRQFLTLYMLVVHAPYPGLWIIAEHLSVGETAEACTMHSIMVGQDIAPATSVVFENYVIKRGLWAEDRMPAFLGFSEKSNALEMCLTTELENLGGPLYELGMYDFITMSDVNRGFQEEKRRKILEFAAADTTLNTQFIAKMVASAQENPTPDNSHFAGIVINAGKYGMFRVNIKKTAPHDHEDSGVPVTILNVNNEEGTVPQINATAGLAEYVRVELTHFRGMHKDLLEQDTELEAVAIFEESGDEHLHFITSTVGCWNQVMSKPFCNFEDYETYCHWELRDVATKEIVFKICVEKYKPPPYGVTVVAGAYGTFRVGLKMFESHDDSESFGQILPDVTVHNVQDGADEIRANVRSGVKVCMQLEHFRVSDPSGSMLPSNLELIAIYQHHGEHELGLMPSSLGAWKVDVSNGVCNFDDTEDHCHVELRNRATKEVVFRVVFTHSR